MHTNQTTNTLRRVSRVSYSETTHDTGVERKERFDSCVESWEECFRKELCKKNVIYVVLMILESGITSSGKIDFPTVIKVGYTGERSNGTLFDRLKEQFRENGAVDIQPIMVMKGTSNVRQIEKEIHQIMKSRQLQISCTPSKYIGLEKNQHKIPREFYPCDEEIIDIVYEYCESHGLELLLNEISEETTIDDFADESRIKSIYGNDAEFTFLDETDSLDEEEIRRLRQYY
jgi:hypothetical protein